MNFKKIDDRLVKANNLVNIGTRIVEMHASADSKTREHLLEELPKVLKELGNHIGAIQTHIREEANRAPAEEPTPQPSAVEPSTQVVPDDPLKGVDLKDILGRVATQAPLAERKRITAEDIQGLLSPALHPNGKGVLTVGVAGLGVHNVDPRTISVMPYELTALVDGALKEGFYVVPGKSSWLVLWCGGFPYILDLSDHQIYACTFDPTPSGVFFLKSTREMSVSSINSIQFAVYQRMKYLSEKA